MTIGIIAFGSLLPAPGREIAAATVAITFGVTPFPVEFARQSKSRDFAPTLVPSEVGSPVRCGVIALDDGMTLQEARDMLFRRESNNEGSGKSEADRPRSWIKEWPGGLGPAEIALYTALEDDLKDATPEQLAEKAIASARAASGRQCRDGISYLAAALDQGVRTPKSAAYEQAILDQLGAATLREALEMVRGLRS